MVQDENTQPDLKTGNFNAIQQSNNENTNLDTNASKQTQMNDTNDGNATPGNPELVEDGKLAKEIERLEISPAEAFKAAPLIPQDSPQK